MRVPCLCSGRDLAIASCAPAEPQYCFILTVRLHVKHSCLFILMNAGRQHGLRCALSTTCIPECAVAQSIATQRKAFDTRSQYSCVSDSMVESAQVQCSEASLTRWIKLRYVAETHPLPVARSDGTLNGMHSSYAPRQWPLARTAVQVMLRLHDSAPSLLLRVVLCLHCR